jgi:hypothetical protein
MNCLAMKELVQKLAANAPIIAVGNECRVPVPIHPVLAIHGMPPERDKRDLQVNHLQLRSVREVLPLKYLPASLSVVDDDGKMAEDTNANECT